jgi:hypothetical protein
VGLDFISSKNAQLYFRAGCATNKRDKLDFVGLKARIKRPLRRSKSGCEEMLKWISEE